MHRLAVAIFLVACVILVSGCLSGQAIKRQAAEPDATAQNNSPNASLQDYYEEPAMEECDCPGSIKTCPDGFNATCENTCQGEACTRCVPTCIGHECHVSWNCSGWAQCANSSQSRLCHDTSGCNKTILTETRVCESDRCSSNSDCPAGGNCTRYFCEGSPKSCRPYVTIPCCGDGVCDPSESCLADCPTNNTQQQANQNAAQDNTSATNATNQTQQPAQNLTNQTARVNYTYASNVSITNITFRTPEFIEIKNSGNASQYMNNWSIEDGSPGTKGHVFVFFNFTLPVGAYARIHTEFGVDNSTDLFWNHNCTQTGVGAQCIWNNDADNATLRNQNGAVISFYSYVVLSK